MVLPDRSLLAARNPNVRIAIAKNAVVRFAALTCGLMMTLSVGHATAAGQSTVKMSSGPDRIVLTNGRLELVIKTRFPSNPCSLRNLKSGRIYADGDYSWPKCVHPRDGLYATMEEDNGTCRVEWQQGRIDLLDVGQTFLASPSEPGVITEEITLRNPTDKPIRAPSFACGFTKKIHDGNELAAGHGRLAALRRALPTPSRNRRTLRLERAAVGRKEELVQRRSHAQPPRDADLRRRRLGVVSGRQHAVGLEVQSRRDGMVAAGNDTKNHADGHARSCSASAGPAVGNSAIPKAPPAWRRAPVSPSARPAIKSSTAIGERPTPPSAASPRARATACRRNSTRPSTGTNCTTIRFGPFSATRSKTARRSIGAKTWKSKPTRPAKWDASASTSIPAGIRCSGRTSGRPTAWAARRVSSVG